MGSRFLLPLAVAALVATAAGCAPTDEAPAGPCVLTVWYRPEKLLADRSLGLTADDLARAELVGSWDGWRRPGRTSWRTARAADDTQWRSLALPLAEGSYRYAILAGRHLLQDELNPRTTFLASPLAGLAASADAAARAPDGGAAAEDPYGTEVSFVAIPDCAAPVLAVDDVASTAAAPGAGEALPTGAVSLAATFTPGSAGDRLDDGALRVELRRGAELLPSRLLTVETRDLDRGATRIAARAAPLPPGKYTLFLAAADRSGRALPPVLASAFVEPATPSAVPAASRRRLDDGVVYQVMVDRFRGAAGPLSPPATPGERAGGTLAGVTAAITAGYFERLGVTTLWLSPLYQNPPGHFTGRDGRPYTAYHGYWPAAPRAVAAELGGESALDALVAAAHARGLRIVIDVVPNHVHESHPYYRERSRRSPSVLAAPSPSAASWFNDGPTACVCGVDCGWDERCWFDTYLPDVNQRNPEALAAEVDDLRFWMARFDLDGLRVDAVPLMPRAATRAFARAVRAAVHREGLDSLLLGETFTGPGAPGRAELRAYLGTALDGLDSEFDFPLLWALRAALATDALGLDRLEQEIAASDRAFAGSGAVMAHTLGNHDTTRFLSEAAGDAGGDPWLTPPPQPTAPAPYRRQVMALALVLTLPGLPVLYYGDEIGLAGATDPDDRRVLPDVLGGALPPPQAAVLAAAARLGRLRACLPALRRGRRRVLLAAADHDVALAEAPAGEGGGPALLVLSRRAATLAIPGVPAGHFVDVLGGDQLVGDGVAPIHLGAGALAAAVYVRADSPCAK